VLPAIARCRNAALGGHRATISYNATLNDYPVLTPELLGDNKTEGPAAKRVEGVNDSNLLPID
jgi:hypothetical protein